MAAHLQISTYNSMVEIRMRTPAQMMMGLELQGARKRWRVVDEIDKANRGSGGHFSTSYIVEDEDHNRAFLKAMDYAGAFQADDPARELEKLTSAFNYERDLLAACAEHNLDRIVAVLDEGKIEVEKANSPVKLVNFLVFELAKHDVSCQVDKVRRLDTAVCLRTMHHVAVGLQQLHGKGITHQDVRPSNVLQFEEAIAKLADLGRAVSVEHSAPHDGLVVPGCIQYAPPEFLYRMDQGNVGKLGWRRGGDIFLLGSMLYFMFQGQMLMPEIQAKLTPEHTPDLWTGSYDDILPYLRKAFAEVAEGFEEELDGELRPKLGAALKQLCEPDPRLRGHPSNVTRGANQHAVERYISLFNLLASRAEWFLKH